VAHHTSVPERTFEGKAEWSGPVAVEGGGPGGGVAATVEPGVVGVGGRCYERVS